MSVSVPTKPGGKKDRRPIWANNDAWRALKSKHNAHRKFNRTNTADSYRTYLRASSVADQTCQAAIRSYEPKLCDNVSHDSKSLFAYATHKRGRSSNKIGLFLKPDGSLTTSANEEALLLSEYFQSVYNARQFVPPVAYPYRPVVSPLCTIQFEPLALLNYLHGLKDGSCPGPDAITYSVLKNCAELLVFPLCQLFSRSMCSGIVPSDWKHAIIQPIHKGGSRTNPSNCRPISLTSTVSKVMELVVRDQMLDYILENGLLNGSQHGFLPGRSTVTQLLQFVDFITCTMDSGEGLDCIMLDFRKAFDSVSHDALLYKLHSYGFQGDLLGWIAAFLTGRTQQVRVCSALSPSAPVGSGVLQGTILGRLLFTIFVDDLDSNVLSRFFKYADDAKMAHRIGRVNPLQDSAILQNDLQTLENWSAIWLLDFNANKCSCLHFGRSNPGHVYSLSGTALPSVQSAKDLGVWFDNTASFSYHCGQIAMRADRIINLIRRSISTYTNLSFLNLHRSIIRPLVEYATSVWCPHYRQDILRIEGVQRRATKLVPHLRHLSYLERLKALNLQTLEIRRERADLILVWKMVHKKIGLELEDFFTVRANSTTRGHRYKLDYAGAKINCRRFFLPGRIVRMWNALPDCIVAHATLASFKRALHLPGGPYAD